MLDRLFDRPVMFFCMCLPLRMRLCHRDCLTARQSMIFYSRFTLRGSAAVAQLAVKRVVSCPYSNMRRDTRIYADRAAYIKRATAKRRKRIRDMALQCKGGKCELCGYSRCTRALDFHHRNPATKLFAISADGCTRSWERVRKEVEKCILVCANCHREIHEGITQLPTETSG